MNVDQTPSAQDSLEASAEEKAELEKMRKAILHRGDRRFWQLVPKRALFKVFWMVLVLLAIVWLQQNTGKVAQVFNQSLSPSPSPSFRPTGSGSPPAVPRAAK